MALNRYMHPRNIYRTPPDFAKLAKDFEEFSDIAKVDVTGKVSIDFKDPKSLRVLTWCLLKSDFQLDVCIPEDRLVPTLPLRLNYVLWIEDLLTAVNNCDSVHGIDIGTGACAIYPLLAAVKNKWHMIGTESDEESFQKAQNNVQRNNLQDFIQLRKTSTSKIIGQIFNNNEEFKFHFCMCNPPFYSNIQDLWESRSPARPPPKNGFTGSPQELITEGGELQFCRKIIEESKDLKDNILIFTTMVGHKYNLKELLQDIQAEGLKHTTTEFCQGRVTRWGLAWTYQDYDIHKLVPPRDKQRKKNAPITFSLSALHADTSNDMGAIVEKIKNILNCLQITYTVINKRQNEIILDFEASTNTWSNQRRKRREMKKIQENDAKRIKLDETAEINNQSTNIKVTVEINKHKVEDNTISNIKVPCETGENSTSEKYPLAHAIMKILKKDAFINVEIEYLDGTGGKEGVHQIIQYIKNNWK